MAGEERALETGSFPSLGLERDVGLGAFVREENKRQAFARLFGSPPERFDRYRLLRIVGQGGMGVVYLAHDDRLDREVAIKLVRTGNQGCERLQREGQAMARLAHANVVRVYEVSEIPSGRDDDHPIAFIVMEYVDGVTLDKWLREPRSRAEVIAAFLAAGRGLAAAHEAGLVHRDFKPQNVLVHRDGRVLVTDFGLAREQHAAARSPIFDTHRALSPLSSGTTVAGTPAYMAPECFRGQSSNPASDQFSFCVALWEAVYGIRPYDGVDLGSLARAALSSQLRRPERSRAPRRLHELLVRGLAVEPEMRWPSMTALLDELEAIVSARRRRTRLTLGFGLVGLAISVVLLVGMLRQRDRELVEKDEDLARANVALARELELSRLEQREAEDALSRQRGLRALAAIDGEREAEALSLAVMAFGAYAPEWSREPPLEARDALESVLVDDARILQPAKVLRGGKVQLIEIEVAPTGKQLATTDRAGVVRLWDPDGEQLIAELPGHSGYINGLAYAPRGDRLATGGVDAKVRLWDAENGEVLARLDGHRLEVVDVVFSPDGSQLASASLDGTARIWDVESTKLIAELDGHEGFVNGAVYLDAGRKLATYSYDRTIKLWDPQTGDLLADLEGHQDIVRALAVSPSAELLASASHDGTTRLWSTSTGESVDVLERQPAHIYSVAFSADGTRLATGGRDNQVRVWDTASHRELASFASGANGINLVAFLPSGRRLLSGNPNEPLRFWELERGVLEAKSAQALFGGVRLATFPADDRVATVDDAGRVWIWDPRGDDGLHRVAGHSQPIRHLAFSPDGKQLATASMDGLVKLWQVTSGALQATLDGHGGPIMSLSYAPSGTQLAAGSEDQDLILWEPTSGRELGRLHGHPNYVEQLAHAPTQPQLASGSLDGSVRVWDVESLAMLALLEADDTPLAELEYAPDGRRLASANVSGRVRVWDAETFERLCDVPGQGNLFNDLDFAPDGRSFVHATPDGNVALRAASDCAVLHTFVGSSGTIWALDYTGTQLALASDELRVWDVADSVLRLVVRAHDEVINDVLLSRDGTQVATASMDHRVVVWSVATGEASWSFEDGELIVEDLALSPDGQWLAGGDNQGRATIWNLADGQILVQLGDRVVLQRDDGGIQWPVPAPVLLERGCQRLGRLDTAGGAIEVCQRR